MRTKKFRIEPFSFFNHTAISAHLEKMARKGWMLEKVSALGWQYRRCTPQAIHFAVSYYPKASEFDPEPSEGQKTLQDFCACAGWELVCTAAQMQIFSNTQEDPTPIETEPELELEAIRASAKKSFLPSYILLLFFGLLQTVFFVSNALGDPINLFSSPAKLFSGLCFFLLALLCAAELVTYLRWLHRAEACAKQGLLLDVPNTALFQRIVLVIILAAATLFLLHSFLFGDAMMHFLVVIMCFYMPLLLLIGNVVKNFLKRRKAQKRINFAVTLASVTLASFLFLGLVTVSTLWASSHGFFAEKDEETYTYAGQTWVAHLDELPLTLEDLVDVENSEAYIRERRANTSFLLGEFVMTQRPRFDAENFRDLPRLKYTVVDVRLPILYETCKERLIYEQEQLHVDTEHAYSYEAEAPEPWSANEVYRLIHSEYGPQNTYLLCYDTLLIELDLDWTPTEAQKAIIGEKLSVL